jgi:hypothetical protein
MNSWRVGKLERNRQVAMGQRQVAMGQHSVESEIPGRHASEKIKVESLK